MLDAKPVGGLNSSPYIGEEERKIMQTSVLLFFFCIFPGQDRALGRGSLVSALIGKQASAPVIFLPEQHEWFMIQSVAGAVSV